MINAPIDIPSSSWRCSLDACMIRRSLWLELDGIDPAFTSIEAAGLDLGFRALRMGAVIEYRPELITASPTHQQNPPPLEDLYTFIYRHYGSTWTKYFYARRSLKYWSFMAEHRAMKTAITACNSLPRKAPVPITRYSKVEITHNPSCAKVSVIIPTLGRYQFLPGALQSIHDQTIKPMEVIIVDQNKKDERQPNVYERYPDLNIRVLWQDERGQSLARNTGLKVAQGEYVLLFDDDSIASPDLIEQHLKPILSGESDVSTGVAFPPPPEHYDLPENFKYPRIAQTFDTGNCLLRRDLIYQMGGFDRNYDFGPGTDSDFGTRLYLAGYRILHNPSAQRIHFKAGTGGLRTHGAVKYNTDAGLLAPFPPITRSYYSYRYLTPYQRREISVLSFMLSKFPRNTRKNLDDKIMLLRHGLTFALKALLLPYKIARSETAARALMKYSPRLHDFSHGEDENLHRFNIEL